MAIRYQFEGINLESLLSTKVDASTAISELSAYGGMGWFEFPSGFNVSVFETLVQAFEPVEKTFSIGIGGSYQGLKLIDEFLYSSFPSPHCFLSYSLDLDYLSKVENEFEKSSNFGVNLISKSGDTLEVHLMLRLFKKQLKKAKWIFVVSSCSSFAKEVAAFLGREVSFIPMDDSTGGRFSLLSQVGVLFLKQNFIDYLPILSALERAKNLFLDHEWRIPWERAFFRFEAYSKGMVAEAQSTFFSSLASFIDWNRQLWSESDGKDGKGLYITSNFYPKDAHSVQQFYVQGQKKHIETFFLTTQEGALTLDQTKDPSILDFKESLLQKTQQGMVSAFLEDRKAEGIAYNAYFIRHRSLVDLFLLAFSEMLAVSIECLLLKVNPFSQPGVEQYKKIVKKEIIKP